jgi:hypothetical protein
MVDDPHGIGSPHVPWVRPKEADLEVEEALAEAVARL